MLVDVCKICFYSIKEVFYTWSKKQQKIKAYNKREKRIDELYKKLNTPDYTDEETLEFCFLCKEKQLESGTVFLGNEEGREKESMCEALTKCGFTAEEIDKLSKDFL